MFCPVRPFNGRSRSRFAHSLLAGTFVFALVLFETRVCAGEIEQFRVPILVYHRFGLTVTDSMTVTVSLFESQLNYLRENDYQIIPLRQLVDHIVKRVPTLPRRAVVITADDGHRSVYERMLPIVRQHEFPVTLFLYPSAISKVDYALKWEQLAGLKKTGLFDVQSHSYWHPDFNQEKRRLGPVEYEKFVRMQLVKAKQVLESKLGDKVDLLAWPFGIFDDELIGKAAAVGYVAGFTIAGRHATPRDPVMALPRYLITQAIDLKVFGDVISGKHISSSKGY